MNANQAAAKKAHKRMTSLVGLNEMHAWGDQNFNTNEDEGEPARRNVLF